MFNIVLVVFGATGVAFTAHAYYNFRPYMKGLPETLEQVSSSLDKQGLISKRLSLR